MDKHDFNDLRLIVDLTIRNTGKPRAFFDAVQILKTHQNSFNPRFTSFLSLVHRLGLYASDVIEAWEKDDTSPLAVKDEIKDVDRKIHELSYMTKCYIKSCNINSSSYSISKASGCEIDTVNKFFIRWDQGKDHNLQTVVSLIWALGFSASAFFRYIENRF